jgi:hypothetical protein
VSSTEAPTRWPCAGPMGAATHCRPRWHRPSDCSRSKSGQVHFASQHLTADTIRRLAFFADCRHEVLPVTEGWRVVLSFDLVLPARNAMPRAPVPQTLPDALREPFFPATGPALRPWVFLLDHEYTERGLHRSLLKGADRSRVAALRAAAEALGLPAYLALAEVHGQWTAAVGGGSRWRGPGTRDDRSDPEPDELIDRDIALNHRADAHDRQLQRHRRVLSGEPGVRRRHGQPRRDAGRLVPPRRPDDPDTGGGGGWPFRLRLRSRALFAASGKRAAHSPTPIRRAASWRDSIGSNSRALMPACWPCCRPVGRGQTALAAAAAAVPGGRHWRRPEACVGRSVPSRCHAARVAADASLARLTPATVNRVMEIVRATLRNAEGADPAHLLPDA